MTAYLFGRPIDGNLEGLPDELKDTAEDHQTPGWLVQLLEHAYKAGHSDAQADVGEAFLRGYRQGLEDAQMQDDDDVEGDPTP